MAEEQKKFEDVTIKCADCGKEFVWSAKDQEFYAAHNFAAPKRCPDCRHARKEARKAAKVEHAKKAE